MTAQKIFNNDVSTDLTDILFEHRNKAYGAYILRKHYDERVNKSLLITMSIFLLFFLLAMIFASHQSPNLALPAGTKTIYNFKNNLKFPPANTPQKKTNTLPPKATAPKPINDKNNIILVKQLTPPALKPDSDKTSQPKTNVRMTIGTAPELTPATPTAPSGPDAAPTGTPAKPTAFPDIKPLFPGGDIALTKYLKRHIEIPLHTFDVNPEGKVYISFIIDVDGSVKDVKLLKDNMGNGCAQNAMDAIKTMPLWTPGKTNGQAIP